MSSYRFEIDVQKTVKRFDPKYKNAQKFLDSEILRDSAPYVPMNTGNLMRSGIIGTTVGSGIIQYNAPYAKSTYYGLNRRFRTDKHPQACAKWFEKAKSVKKDIWIAGANKIIKGEQ